MRTWISALSLGLVGGSLVGLARAASAVRGHGLLASGLGPLWRELIRGEWLPAAGVGLAAGALLASLGTVAGSLGVSRSARTAAGTCAALVAAVAGTITWVLRGRLASWFAETPGWVTWAVRAVLITVMLSLLWWVVRRLYPRLQARLEGELESDRARAPKLLWGAGALAALGVGGLELAHRSDPGPAASAPNLFLVTIDTLRADHLGSYGYTRDTSPRLDALAAGGVRFERAVSQAPWTLPSMASVHTSLYPSQHGANRGNRPLQDAHATLAEVLRSGGYHTIGVVSHLFVSDRFGFNQGFDVFDERSISGHEGVSSRRLTATALELLGEAPPEPFFLWVHYFDPHYDYVDHDGPDFAQPGRVGLGDRISFEFLEAETEALTEPQVAEVIALYDEEIAHTDASIGGLLDGLEGLGLARPLVTAVTADHGELFRERGRFGHGREVYGELVNVPLILAGPAELVGPPRTEARPVEISALPRTLSGLAGLGEGPFLGADLLSAEAAGAAACFEGGYASGPDSRKLGALDAAGWKLIHNLDAGTRELYHLPTDPGERVDRSGDPECAAALARLEARLAELAAELPGFGAAGAEVELDAGELEHLRNLGYVE